MATQQYIIKININNQIKPITIAGFSVDEQSEDTISRHLFNLCKQSNGNFNTTHHLLLNAIAQWQNCINLQSTQIMHYLPLQQSETIKNISLYKAQQPNCNQLINSFSL